MNRKRSQRHAVLLLALSSALPGCASVHVDEHGRTHVAGFVWLTLPPSEAAPAANVVRTRSVGMVLTNGPEGGSIVIGYSDQTLATIYNQSVVRLPVDMTTDNGER